MIIFFIEGLITSPIVLSDWENSYYFQKLKELQNFREIDNFIFNELKKMQKLIINFEGIDKKIIFYYLDYIDGMRRGEIEEIQKLNIENNSLLKEKFTFYTFFIGYNVNSFNIIEILEEKISNLDDWGHKKMEKVYSLKNKQYIIIDEIGSIEESEERYRGNYE